MRVLLLWDVDHTLVDNAGVSKEIYAATFEAITGSPPTQPARTGGRTDRRIMQGMFARHELEMPAWHLVARELAQAGADRAEAMRTRGSVLPGVADAVRRLAGDRRFVQSVLTGNIRPNAEMKVCSLGLGRHLNFDIGAYGDDSDDRAELVAIAQQRAGQATSKSFDAENTVLVGDTPRDVDAALRGGARIVAVATGVHSEAELTAAGASVVMSTMEKPSALIAHLLALD